MVARGRGLEVGEMVNMVKKVETSSLKKKKSHGDVKYSLVTIVNKTVSQI